MNECLETPKQLAKRVGLTEGKIRHLINTRQLEHIWIGSRVHVPTGAFGRFIRQRHIRTRRPGTHIRSSDVDRHVRAWMGAALGRPHRGNPEKHWHGATPTTAMTHIAIQEALNGKVVDWMEHVSDEQYRA